MTLKNQTYSYSLASKYFHSTTERDCRLHLTVFIGQNTFTYRIKRCDVVTFNEMSLFIKMKHKKQKFEFVS